jgi:hypothetical protein
VVDSRDPYEDGEDFTMGSVTLTADQICAVQSWPFPCERGKIIDPVGILKFLGATAVFTNGSGGATAYFSNASHSAPADERLPWVELVTGATIGRATAAQQAADTLEGAGDTVFAANQSAIGKFVDGLIASPPLFDSIELVPVTVVVGWIVIVIPSPPPRPNWEAGEQLSGIDLLSIGSRFQAAAAAIDTSSLQKEFLAAGARLFEAGAARL